MCLCVCFLTKQSRNGMDRGAESLVAPFFRESALFANIGHYPPFLD